MVNKEVLEVCEGIFDFYKRQRAPADTTSLQVVKICSLLIVVVCVCKALAAFRVKTKMLNNGNNVETLGLGHF